MSPAILFGAVKGEIFSRDAKKDAGYIASSDRHFSFQLSDAEYDAVMATVEERRNRSSLVSSEPKQLRAPRRRRSGKAWHVRRDPKGPDEEARFLRSIPHGGEYAVALGMKRLDPPPAELLAAINRRKQVQWVL